MNFLSSRGYVRHYSIFIETAAANRLDSYRSFANVFLVIEFRVCNQVMGVDAFDNQLVKCNYG